MPAFLKQQGTDSSLSTDNKTDRTLAVREPDPWRGQTNNQALFFVTLTKLLLSNYDFNQLITTATVTMKDGIKAVFSAEHALEHAKRENVGTAREPNTRRRVSVATRLPTAGAPATTPAPAAGTHGGHPTPTPSTTGTSTTSSRQSQLEAMLGAELANEYKIAPEIIEMKDGEILNFIMKYLGADRLKELWMKKADQNGGGARGFLVAFVADMARRGVSFTIEETVETQMSQILEAGLPDPSFMGFLEMSSAYEEMNQVCKHPKTEAEIAYKYRRVIAALDPRIEHRLDTRISMIESEMRSRGEKPEDHPIDLITEAAGIVLEEESNLEILKSLKAGGRALNAQGRFDPQRNSRNGGGGGGGGGAAAQTWATNGAGPTVHTPDMRNCWFCDNKYTNTPQNQRQHVDLDCPNATKQEKDALRKERISKAKAKHEAWKARKAAKGGNPAGASGGAKVAQGGTAVDDADEAAAERIFANGNNGDSMLLELGQLIDGKATVSAKDGQSLMASAAIPLGRLARTHSDAPSVTDTTSVSTLLSPDARAAHAPPSSSGAATTQAPVDDSHVYVLKPSGDEARDSVSSGIWCGNWKLQVLPGISYALEQEKLPVDRKNLKNLSVKYESFEEAVHKCKKLDIAPIFMGPSPFTDDSGSRLNVGEDVSEFLAFRCHSADDESSDPGSDSDSSSPGSDHDDRDGATTAPPQDEHDDPQLGQLCAEIEGYTVNTHVDILRAAIRRHQLTWQGSPISPSTGGSQRRTKYDILQEMRQAVGAAPLPSSAASTQRRRPDVPMGTPVDGRRLDFGAQPQRGTVNTVCGCWLPVLVLIMAQLLALLVGSGTAPPCRMIAPSWVCDSLGYDGTTLALPSATLDATAARRDDLYDIPRKPGEPHCEEVDPWLDSGGSGRWGGIPMVLPGLVCIALLLCTLETTVRFFDRSYDDRLNMQAKPSGKGLGRPQGPPRDITTRTSSSPSSRTMRRHASKRSNSVASTSLFVSTLGEAPLWLSLVFLVHELTTRVIPFLFAISLGTLLAGVLRATHSTMCVVGGSWVMTPARVAMRIVLNLGFVSAYLGYCAFVDTFVSKPTWPPTTAATDSSNIIGAIYVVMHSVRALALNTCSGLRRWGGVAIDKVLTRAPTPTDPNEVDYSVNTHRSKRRPRALHAFNSRASPQLRARIGTTSMVGRALNAAASKIKLPVAKAICWAVIDSGCSWHCHPHVNDLINRRPCFDTMTGIDGKPQRVKCIGDLPIYVRDSTGFWRHAVIRNVRCVPSFTDTLISVDQFWEESKVNCIFNDVRCIHVPSQGDYAPMDLPFKRLDNLYRWAIVPVNRDPRLAQAIAGSDKTIAGERALKATIHRPNSSSFFNALPPNEQLEMLHRRLHVGYNLIKRLADAASDVPASIKKGMAHDCEHCKAANATHVPHPGKSYQPSHVGRLIHGDLAGPFQRSHHGFRYFLILVDDHSRFKQVYFLKSKSEALQRVRSFVAKLNALSSIGKPEPVRVIGQLHMDNAGEFLSGEFNEFLDSELITRTTCPPHVHQLNGVAERAIRSIMEVVRSTREASRCPVTFWPHLVEHAVDVLNRTTGPPHDGKPYASSHQVVTGEAPKVLTILPIGCRAYAVKPVGSYVKSNFESRAWHGVNLGRCSTIPNAYNIWLPEQSKVIQTSEVYFDESLFPWRPKGDQRIGTPAPTSAPAADPSDISAGGAHDPAAAAPPPASSLPEAFASATRDANTCAYKSKRLLLLFSGAYNRPDGLAQFARQLGLEVDLFDSDPNVGGGASADITKEAVYGKLRERIVRGTYAAIIAAPPCSTFSISRFFESSSSSDGGPPPVRTRTEIEGCRFIPAKHRAELERANDVVNKMCSLLHLAHHAGTEIIIENPADRGDLSQPNLFLNASHGPLWLMPAVCALIKRTSAKTVTFAMCAFGAPWQKATTLLYTAGFDAWLDVLRDRQCDHRSHAKLAGGEKTKSGWNSNEAAAYPPDFNSYLAQAVAAMVKQRSTPVAAPPVDNSGPDVVTKEAPKDTRPRAPPPPTDRRAPATSAPAVAGDATQTELGTADGTLEAVNETIGAQIENLSEATSIRRLSFAEEEIAHEEPDAEVEPTVAQADKPRRRHVHFEKTAGARATRSQNPTLLRGIGNSAGYVMSAVGMSVAASAYALGTVNLFDEFARQGTSTLRAALAKPSSADPKTQTEAYARDKEGWKASETKELKNHEANGSWEYIDASQLPRGRRLVKLIWVYKVKRDGTLKSRLCVQGCRQVAGVDYDQTWCGAMRGTSLRTLSNLAAIGGMRMRRYDFVAAYLQGELLEGETVYCYAPPGYERKGADGKNQICRILKPVYGMAQAGRRWQRTLFPWLKEYGFRQTDSDQSVFTIEGTMHTPNGPRMERLYVGVYVDDLAIVYSHDDEHSLYRHFVTALESRWNVEDEGELTDLLGIEFSRVPGAIELRQTSYIEKLASEFFPDGVPSTAQANKVPCDKDLPMLVHMALLDDATPDPQLLRRYQSICGALLYASTNTRPDIAFATGMLCRAMGRPTPELYQAALRVLAYLYRNRHIALRYETTRDANLEGFSDSDWAVKHSTSGYTFHLGSASISWSSKKQTTVALSSCEAEIMAGSEAAKEAIYLSSFLRELGMNLSQPPPLKLDNKSAIDLAYNPEHHSKTKHIERRHYFIRECVENGKLRVPFVPTKDNCADFFTKPMTGKMFFDLRDKVMNVPRGRDSDDS